MDVSIFLGLIWALFEVPEFKYCTFSDLDDLFAQKTLTRGFKNHIVDELDLLRRLQT